MNDYTFSRTENAFVERILEWLRNKRRHCAASQRLFSYGTCLLAMTELDFAQVQLRLISIARETEKKILQRKIVQHHDPGARLHRVKNTGVITMVVAHVIDHRIKLFQPPEKRTLPPVITNLKPRRQLGINRMK